MKRKLIIVLAMAMALSLFLAACGSDERTGEIIIEPITGGSENKRPENLTKEDYDELSPEEKAVFPDNFDSMDEYNEWYDKTIVNEEGSQPKVPEIDLGDKKSEDITYEEYIELTPEEKAVLPDSFESLEKYYEWYNRVVENNNSAEIPVLDLKGKKPGELTLEDYNKLTPEEKAVLPDVFDSMKAYNEWYDRVVGNDD